MRVDRRWLTGAALAILAGLPEGHAVELLAGMAPVLIDQVQVLPDNAQTPPAEDAAWQAATLPDRWAEERPEFQGSVWYGFSVEFAHIPVEPWSVLLLKTSMNADVWVNGALAGRIGRMDEPLTRHWNKPLLFQIPPTVWRVGDNLVHVRVKARVGHDGGLGRMWIGPADSTAAIFGVRNFWQSTTVSIAVIAIFALSLVFLFIWLRKRQDMHYGYFALGTLCWGVANTNMAVTTPPLPDPIWEWLVHVALIWALLLQVMFGLRYAGQRLLRLERGALCFALAAAVLMAVVPESWRQATDLALLLPVIATGAWALRLVSRNIGPRPFQDYVLFVAAATVTVAIGVHDWFLRGGYLPYEHAYGLPFVAPVLLGTMAWLVAGDLARAQRDLAQLNQDLGLRVQQRDAQLRETYARLGHSERERAVVAERARIMRDMHDGVGAHLSAAIRQIEAGRASSEEVAQSLRDSLDQLKLSVDAMTLPSGDVNALLAAMRYRLQPRIHAAGLSLDWEVDILPPWQIHSSTAMRHLQHMLFEAFSNALQHSQARSLRLSARAAPAGIVVALSDDGRGFQVAPEQVLRSLRERARLIDAVLEIETGATGSCVRMVLSLA